MEKQLTRRQILTMKRKNLELKVRKFWNDTQNADLVIEYIVAILVRNALVKSDFSQPCPDVVRELLFQAEPSDTLRNFIPFLKDYVEEHEWKTIVKKLFHNEKKYYKATKKMRLYESYLKDRGNAVINEEYASHTLVAIFLDENGKKHTWRLRDADPSNTLEETIRILKILTTLTIFKKDDVRQFASYVNCYCIGSSTIFNSRTPEEQPREQSAQNSPRPTVEQKDKSAFIGGFDLHSMTKTELIVMIKRIFEEVEAASLEEETEANERANHDSEVIIYDHKTRLKDRITPENESDSLVVSSKKPKQPEPALAAVGAVSEDNGEKPPEKEAEQRPRKKPTKKERELLRRFRGA